MVARTSSLLLLFVLASSSAVLAEDTIHRAKFGEVEVELFVPADARPVRGLVVHVFNYKMKSTDRWATLCRELKWAHLNTIISRKANNRPKKIREAIETSLAKFAAELNLPELVHVPRTGTGFSAGGMVTKVLETTPDKMLTNGISCSWVRDPVELGDAASVPELFIIGAQPDGFKMLPAIEKFYEPAIAANRPWCLGLQHGCKHDWANSGTLIVPWIQAIAKLRYPDNYDATKPAVLKPIDFASGWRGDRTTIKGQFATVAPASEFQGDPAQAAWLPDRATAYVWRAWHTKNSPIDLAARPGKSADASDVAGKQLGPFQPRKSFGMTIATDDNVTLGVTIKKELPITSVAYYHGDTLIGTSKSAPWEVNWKPPAAGCYAIWAWYTSSKSPAVTNPALFCVEPTQ